MTSEKPWPSGLHAAFILPISSLRDLPLHWILRKMEELRVAGKVLTRYQFDNEFFRVSNLFGHEFSFQVYQKTWALNVQNLLRERTEAWVKGAIKCSDCGDSCDAKEALQRRYFAGLYCESCWLGDSGEHRGKGGWKTVEARQNYD